MTAPPGCPQVSFDAFVFALRAAEIVGAGLSLTPASDVERDLELDSFEMFRLFVLVTSALPPDYDRWDDVEVELLELRTLGEIHGLVNEELRRAHADGWFS
jgi:hypothetical protein